MEQINAKIGFRRWELSRIKRINGERKLTLE